MPTDRPESASCPSSPGDGPRVRVVLVLFRAPDYPAAHSMDHHWYTVDAKGNVAVFDPGSSGPLPKKAKLREWPDLAPLVAELGGPDLIPEGGEHTDSESVDAYRELAALGVFVFEYSCSTSAFIDPFVREHRPRRPMHLDQLPPKLRKEFARVPLPVPDLAAVKKVQLVEHVPCEFWWDGVVGYYTLDGKQVRPIPGREAEYRAALPELRREYRKLRFAEVPEGPGGKKQRPKKGRKP